MPTLCALAGADTGSPLGIDLSSVLLDKKTVLKDRSPPGLDRRRLRRPGGRLRSEQGVQTLSRFCATGLQNKRTN